MAVYRGRQLSKLATRISEPRIARTYCLNLIYFCRKYTILTKFNEFMLQKVLKFAYYAMVMLSKKIILFCSNYAKNYASTIRQGLIVGLRTDGQSDGQK